MELNLSNMDLDHQTVKTYRTVSLQWPPMDDLQKRIDYENWENKDLREKLENAISHLEELFPLKNKVAALKK